MTQNTAGDKLQDRRKKLIFRSWHRGTREIDLILGRFADEYVPKFTEDEMGQYEALLLNPDPDIYNWVSGREPVPPEHDSTVIRKLIGFSGRGL